MHTGFLRRLDRERPAIGPRSRSGGAHAPAAVAVVAVALALVAAPPAGAATTKTVRYGPYTIPAASGDSPGMTGNKLRFAVSRPCLDCFITSFTPDLAYGDGTRAGMETGAMLHHAVFTSQWRSDATCSGTVLGLAGERFFASGHERTVARLPAGYGYRVRWYDSWNLLVDLMNTKPYAQTVYVTVTFTYESRWAGLTPVKPVWLDIDNCRDSEYRIPAGESSVTRRWSSPVEGGVVHALGHVHDYGVRVTATNVTTGRRICNSVADGDMGHVMGMSTCTGDPLARLSRGDVIELESVYNSPEERDDVMGIMLMYVGR